jgi:hypothetical protein
MMCVLAESAEKHNITIFSIKIYIIAHLGFKSNNNSSMTMIVNKYNRFYEFQIFKKLFVFRYGFVIAVTTIDNIGAGLIQPSRGFVVYPVKYKAIVFRPFKGEVLAYISAIYNHCNMNAFFFFFFDLFIVYTPECKQQLRTMRLSSAQVSLSCWHCHGLLEVIICPGVTELLALSWFIRGYHLPRCH